MKASVILIVAGLAVAKSAGTSMRYTEQAPANTLIFHRGADVSPVFIQCSSIYPIISEGQPYGGVFCGYNNLVVMAGRNGTKPVADVFKGGLNAWNMMATVGGHGTPELLNFDIEADFSMKLGGSQGQDMGTYSLRIGQGHNPGQNNWWIGGEHCSRVECGITCGQGEQYVTFKPNDVYTLDVSFDGCS
jgi:hypothetical protein